jgi:hypothetical protein
LAAAPAAFIATGPATARYVPSETKWNVRASEGFDALAFLGPLSGEPLYQRFYAKEAAEFGSRMSAESVQDIKRLWDEAAKAGFGLLAPSLSVIYSGGSDDHSLGSIIVATRDRQRLLDRYRASRYWDEKDWDWFEQNSARLLSIFQDMEKAGFAEYRSSKTGNIGQRVGEVRRALGRYNVIALQERLTGRRFDPDIEVVLLQFCRPHGIKVQGQRFLQFIESDVPTTVRNAAHEMLHPPIDMEGAAAKAALAVLGHDELITRIVRDHDPKWGYTTLDGLLNEDLCQALDQIISEELGVARNPSDRWRKADDGIHVLAAGLYGMFRQDRWIDQNGSLEYWLHKAAVDGRLAPKSLHAIAARILERTPATLWPVPTSPPPAN